MLLEAAAFESRAGRDEVARLVFQYLMAHVSWVGPVFYEASRFEEKRENYRVAVDIVHAGLRTCGKYGPLWFALMRLSEKLHGVTTPLSLAGPDGLPDTTYLQQARGAVEQALLVVSKELIWKVHFEAAGLEERVGNWAGSRYHLACSAQAVAPSLRWKVYLGGTCLFCDDIVSVQIRACLQFYFFTHIYMFFCFFKNIFFYFFFKTRLYVI